MARNHNFFFDQDGSPKARGPASEKVFMSFLEVDVQGSDYICRDLMDDLTAIEDESDDLREFTGNAHHVTITANGVLISPNLPDSSGDAENQISGQVSATTENQVSNQRPAAAENPTTSEADVPAETQGYLVPLKHFREILEDWEAFILDDQLDDPMADEEFL